MALNSVSALAAEQSQNTGLAEIVVTAQKREQNSQDVPVAVTAVSGVALQTNRITNVQDLNALAPNVAVISPAGDIGQPFIAARGLLSQGGVGKDSSAPIYIDGVALGAGSGGVSFEMPDISRIEVLRGPQGTLFGRNSTIGAISISTRDPSGNLHIDQELTYGNYKHFRSMTRIETPEVGGLSALVSYYHEEREGDIKNLGAGQVWDRSIAGLGKATSPKTLGDKNVDSVFAAVKFQPSNDFKTVLKFDYTQNDFTPSGVGLLAFTPCVLDCSTPFSFGSLLQATYDANPTPMASIHRPKAVNNNYAVPSRMKNWGFNLTSNWSVGDDISLKNVLGYRKSSVFGNSNTSGMGGLKNIYSFLGPVGEPYLVYETNNIQHSTQFSDELQLNYESSALSLTAGMLYFNILEGSGAPHNMTQTPSFQTVPGGVFVDQPTNFNNIRTTSFAGYVQAEGHVTSQIDLIAGIRLTHDEKTGTNTVSTETVTEAVYAVNYADTRPTYTVGVNYKPTDDIMAYAKYAYGYVAGGQISGKTFKPEQVRSYEAGIKTDWLNHHLRFNLTAFVAHYRDVQAVTSGIFVGDKALGLVVISGQDRNAKGVEMEVSAAPFHGLTLNGGFGYTDWRHFNVNPILAGQAQEMNIPHATATLGATYQSDPILNGAHVIASLNGAWRSKERQYAFDTVPAEYQPSLYSPAGWVLNGRLALADIPVGSGKVEIAAWAKNLTDSDRPNFAIDFTFLASTAYEQARTFGVDVGFHF